MTKEAVACVDCFHNAGFRSVLLAYAGDQPENCKRCGCYSQPLTSEDLHEAIHTFFVQGSLVSETWAPVYQVNTSNPNPARFDETLDSDAKLVSELTGQVIFHYGPPFWRIGQTELKNQFDDGAVERANAAQYFVEKCIVAELSEGTRLFRIRRNPETDESISTGAAFDPPPPEISRTPGRWDDGVESMLYASDDVELCLHECRVTLADEIIVAELLVKKSLKLLDLSADIPGIVSTPFDDLNIFSRFLSMSRGAKWLSYSRLVSQVAREAGFDGIRYFSYYAQIKHENSSLNVALFGRPIENGSLIVNSVNRLRLSDAKYSYTFGPVLYNDSEMKAEMASIMEKIASGL